MDCFHILAIIHSLPCSSWTMEPKRIEKWHEKAFVMLSDTLIELAPFYCSLTMLDLE